MKKPITFIAIIILLTGIAAGCDTPGSITLNDTYTLLLYDNSLVDTFTERVDHQIIANESIDETASVPNKTVTLFGKTHNFKHLDTTKRTTSLYNRVTYEVETGDYYLASFDSVTEELVYYANASAGKNRGYQSEVNDRSSEAEFLAYAKKLVSQHRSVEGCQVEITTEICEFDASSGNFYPRNFYDGYVNNTENISDFYAVYKFIFYKTIDGIRRYDTNVIEINNTGEVHRSWFDMQDELYADFADIDVDIEQAEILVKDALAKCVPDSSSAEIVPSLVATSDGVLWLQLEVAVRFQNGTSGVNIYMIQIASSSRT